MKLLASVNTPQISLFRQAAYRFCNFKVYGLTNNYPGLSNLELNIAALLKLDRKDMLKGIAHEAFVVSTSRRLRTKAMLLRMPALINCMGMVRRTARGLALKHENRS